MLCGDRMYLGTKRVSLNLTATRALSKDPLSRSKISRNNLGSVHQRNQYIFRFTPRTNSRYHRGALSRYNLSLGVRDKRLLLFIMLPHWSFRRSNLKDDTTHNAQPSIYNFETCNWQRAGCWTCHTTAYVIDVLFSSTGSPCSGVKTRISVCQWHKPFSLHSAFVSAPLYPLELSFFQ